MDNLLNSFKNSKILVVGDVMIDGYLYGKVNRISPEAPVPVLDVERREYRLGGAANVALNLKMLGATPLLCSVSGDDVHKEMLQMMLKQYDIDSSGIIYSNHRKTTLKRRIIGNRVQILRIDEEECSLLLDQDAKLLTQFVLDKITNEKFDGLIFVDYDKGVLSQEMINTMIEHAHKHSLITTVDPKNRNFHHYNHVTLFKPNLKELLEGMGQKEQAFSLEKVRTLMEDFAQKHNLEIIMTTLSENGIAIYRQKDHYFFHQPAYKRTISDVSGAGDTVIAVVTLALAADVPPETMVKMANIAGGVVCEYAGVAPITDEMLKKEWQKREPELQ